MRIDAYDAPYATYSKDENGKFHNSISIKDMMDGQPMPPENKFNISANSENLKRQKQGLQEMVVNHSETIKEIPLVTA